MRCVGLAQSGEALMEKTEVFPKEKGILWQTPFQPEHQLFPGSPACPAECGLASPHNHMSNSLK